MSKTTLKKELNTLSQEQLVQVVLDAYSSNSEFKEYFEFFLNPDVNKLIEKHEKKVVRELGKTKWGTSKARITVLKNSIKSFAGYNPGAEEVMKYMLNVLNRMGMTERYVDFTKAQMTYVERLAKQIIEYGDKNELATEAIEKIEEILKNPNYTSYFRKHVSLGAAGEIGKF